MWNRDLSIYGRHSQLIRKYVKPQKKSETSTSEYTRNDYYLFSNMVDGFLTSAMLGILFKKKSVEEGGNKESITIFAGEVSKRSHLFERVYQHTIIHSEMAAEEKLIKISQSSFTDEEIKNIEKSLKSYALGGLDVIEKFFGGALSEQEFVDVLERLNAQE